MAGIDCQELFSSRQVGVVALERLAVWIAEMYMQAYSLRFPHLQDGRWMLPNLGISILVPPGFVASSERFVYQLDRYSDHSLGIDGGLMELYGPGPEALSCLPADVRKEAVAIAEKGLAKGSEGEAAPIIELMSDDYGSQTAFLVGMCDTGMYVVEVNLVGASAGQLARDMWQSAVVLDSGVSCR
ncbi:MAG: hypothetical protein H6716_22785 [Polyangiaceae bacterium]|nr:hypothetical protein [Polyangiaceae bacterium]